ncbi:MAG: hypothetical protein QM767_26255 [Anaeromyxobacter sp.]
MGKKTVFGNEKKVIETTAGRVLFNEIWPEGHGFLSTRPAARSSSPTSSCAATRSAGHQATVETLDRLKELGFQWATTPGVSIGIADMIIPE